MCASVKIFRHIYPIAGIFKNVIKGFEFLHYCREMMVNGKYKFDVGNTLIYEVEYKEYANNESLFQYNNIYRKKQQFFIKDFLRKLLSCLITMRINTSSKSFNGQVISLATMGKNAKIYDYKNNIMLSVFLNRKDFKTVVDNRQIWGTYFRTPKCEIIDNDFFIIKEQLIPKNNFDSVDMFFQIISNYAYYFGNISHKPNLDISHRQIDKFGILLSIDTSELKLFLKSANYGECIVHGDLWSSNIIFDGENSYYIDFENVGQRFFCYDLFLYMFIDYILGKEKLINDYIEGKLNDSFSFLFQSFGSVYDARMRNVYFYTFLLFYYLEFWQNTNALGSRVVEIVHKIKKL